MKAIFPAFVGGIVGSLITLAVVHFAILQPARTKIEASRRQLRIDARDSRDSAAEIYRQTPNVAPTVSKLLTFYGERFDRHADELP